MDTTSRDTAPLLSSRGRTVESKGRPNVELFLARIQIHDTLSCVEYVLVVYIRNF